MIEPAPAGVFFAKTRTNVTGSLERFLRAQADEHSGFGAAIAELSEGRKRGHWIWYVFPQIRGLGSSAQSVQFALHDIDEAAAFLEDPVLGPRLLEAATAVASHVRRGASLQTVMGASIDVLKLVSSLTLFEAAAARVSGRDQADAARALAAVAGEILEAARVEGYPRCEYTLASVRA